MDYVVYIPDRYEFMYRIDGNTFYGVAAARTYLFHQHFTQHEVDGYIQLLHDDLIRKMKG